jgi:hypothetical protein
LGCRFRLLLVRRNPRLVGRHQLDHHALAMRRLPLMRNGDRKKQYYVRKDRRNQTRTDGRQSGAHSRILVKAPF